MLTEYNIKRHYDSKHADGVYGKLKGRNQELKVYLFKRAARTMLCLLLFGPLLKRVSLHTPASSDKAVSITLRVAFLCRLAVGTGNTQSPHNFA